MTHKNEWMESMFPEVADCSISISKTVTQKEWRKIYREVLPLSKKLDFCYVKKFDFEGVKGQCLVRPTEIAENFYGLITHKLKLEGLYSQRLAIGPIYIDTKLLKDWCEQETGSAFLGYAYDDNSLSINMLGDELENQTFIINILAIAFFIESRLPEKIFVYGSFPYEYALEAVNKINKYLKEPVGLPVVCRAKDLIQQIQQTILSDKEKFELFCNTYRGVENEELWKLLNATFPENIIQEYLKENQKNNEEETQTSQEDILDDEDETAESKVDSIDKQYDIELSSQLFAFKKGKSINPDLLKDVITVLNNVEPAKEQKGYKDLSENSPLDQIRKLAAFKEGLVLLDKDWKHIIHCFKTKKNALERYYPLFMVSCDSYGITSNITRALMVNDALYKYGSAMQKKQKQEDLLS